MNADYLLEEEREELIKKSIVLDYIDWEGVSYLGGKYYYFGATDELEDIMWVQERREDQVVWELRICEKHDNGGKLIEEAERKWGIRFSLSSLFWGLKRVHDNPFELYKVVEDIMRIREKSKEEVVEELKEMIITELQSVLNEKNVVSQTK